MARSLDKIQNPELALWGRLKDQDWLGNLANKLSELRWLLPKFPIHDQEFREAGSVLELGAGEGWSSCVVKRLYPQLRVVASDISPAAIEGIDKWEGIFEATVDSQFACKSYAVPLPDASVGLIFAFQAAHHFHLHEETLREAVRLLKPGGVCMYLNEPSCKKYLYKIAYWRVNRKRPECPEDVLVVERMQDAAAAAALGLKFELSYSTNTINRGVVEGVYYKLLSIFPALCRWLPCTADFIFTKAV